MEKLETSEIIVELRIGLSDGLIPPGTPLGKALGNVHPEALGAEIDGKILGLEDPVYQSGIYKILTSRSPRARELLWHTASHILAQAVLRLYPHAKLGIGPAIKDGFYYDFDFGTPISSDDLPRIESEMRREVEENYPLIRNEISREEALNYFQERGQIYKVELIHELDSTITTYSQAEFTDLCKGPHL
ncbi:MAG: threonine--tRNA ligase, partial [bacterium]